MGVIEIRTLVKSKFFILALIMAPLLSGCLLIFVNTRQVFPIFPAPSPAIEIIPENDAIWGGKSSVDRFRISENAIDFTYTLREGSEFPMTYILIGFDKVKKKVDLSAYSHLSIHLGETSCREIVFYLKTFQPGISLEGPENAVTLRHNVYNLFLKPGVRKYMIRLRDFRVPHWWTDQMGLEKEALPEENFKRAMGMNLQFAFAYPQGMGKRQEHIRIEKIVFHKSPFSLPPLLLILAALWYGSLIALWGFKGQKKGEAKPLPTGHQLSLSFQRDQEFQRILEFIKAHYTDQDISTQRLYQALGIPVKRISHLLKQHYHLSFKQLINKMRIREAQRLIRETEVPISDIAFNVGFNDISYFYKLFKQEQGGTPASFRGQKEARE